MSMRNYSLKFRFYPSPEQEIFLNRSLGCARKVFNLALAEHEQKRASDPKTKWNGYEYVKRITVWKQDPDLFYLSEVSITTLQQSVLNLDRAFKNMFNGNARKPKFKSRKAPVNGMRLTRGSFRLKNKELFIAKVKQPLRVIYSRALPDNLEPTSISITKKSSGKWFVAFSYQDPNSNLSLPVNNKVLGIDLGLESYLTTSEGEKVANPRFYRKHQAKLSREQRKLSRKQKDSNNYHKQRRKVARVHEKVANSRLDFLHKLSTRLIRENQTVIVEDLCVKDMLANASKGLSKSISDASWSEFVRQLEYKASWYARNLVKVDRYFPSSQICNSCGTQRQTKLSLNDRVWACPSCGGVLDRDVNAAKNILTAGLAGSVCGSKSHV
jgi:putative transposase